MNLAGKKVRGKGARPQIPQTRKAVRIIQAHASVFMERFKKANRHFDSIEVLGEYAGVRTKIPCRCKVCGFEWGSSPANLLDGCGCPKCAGVHRRTQDEFLTEFATKNPHCQNIALMGRFLTTKTPIECLCKVCGHKWSPTPERLLRGSGCPRCVQRINGEKRRHSHEEFLAAMNRINPLVVFTSQYQNYNTPLGCKCQKCGYEWLAAPSNLLKGKGCPNCAHKVRLTHKEFIIRISRNPHIDDIELLGEYKNASETIHCRCKICGHEWNALPSTLYRGGGCKMCGNVRKGLRKLRSIDAFISAFRKRNKQFGSIELIGEYRGGKEAIECKCKVCGHNWAPLPENLLKGKGCPHCAHRQTSFAEQFLYWGLVCKLGTNAVLSRDRSTIGKELDIVIPKWRLAIEYGSWFWHRKRLKTDGQKTLACREKGFELLVVLDGLVSLGEVPIPSPVDHFKMFPQDLGSEMGYGGLKSILREILASKGEDAVFSDAEWKRIEQQAIDGSRLLTDEEFALALCRQNASADAIEIIGKYSGPDAKILCKCKKCGHKWSPRANNLLRNHGCPQCACARVGSNRRIQIHEFMRRLKDRNSRWDTIELVGPFKGTTSRLLCKCRICKHEWMAYPFNLLKGHACPMCGRRRKTMSNTQSSRKNLSFREKGQTP